MLLMLHTAVLNKILQCAWIKTASQNSSNMVSCCKRFIALPRITETKDICKEETPVYGSVVTRPTQLQTLHAENKISVYVELNDTSRGVSVRVWPVCRPGNATILSQVEVMREGRCFNITEPQHTLRVPLNSSPAVLTSQKQPLWLLSEIKSDTSDNS